MVVNGFEPKEQLSRLQSFSHLVHSKVHHFPTVVLNKCDTDGEGLSRHPENIYTDKDVIESMEALVHDPLMGHYNLSQIFPTKSYTHERKRFKILEVIALMAFKHAFDNAYNFLKMGRHIEEAETEH